MTGTKDFTARFRTSHEAWEQLGDRIGDRNRSAELDAFLAWRNEHPDAELPANPEAPEQVHDFFVRVRITTDRRRVEVVELPTGHGRDDALKAEIVTAIVEHFNPPEPQTRRPRRVR